MEDINCSNEDLAPTKSSTIDNAIVAEIDTHTTTVGKFQRL